MLIGSVAERASRDSGATCHLVYLTDHDRFAILRGDMQAVEDSDVAEEVVERRHGDEDFPRREDEVIDLGQAT